MDACLRRDARAAADLTREHIVNAGKSLVAFLREKA
jgi:DNA-binding GntR family transcriptional regulator